MSRVRFRGALPLALIATFGAGVVADGWFRTHGAPQPAPTAAAGDVFLAAPGKSAAPIVSGSSRTNAPAAPVVSGVSRTDAALRVPIDGMNIESLRGGFAERRGGGGRPHEAVDILAPMSTPVHAVADGSVAKLFTSKQGGLTIYQFDADAHLCYYYAHLDRYADGLKDGQTITAGDVVGYVGTTGNAPPGTPHLHFAVFELNADKRWWQGRPIDPYQLFRDKG